MAETVNATPTTPDDTVYTVGDLRTAMNQLDEALCTLRDIQQQLAQQQLSSEVVDDVLGNLPYDTFIDTWNSDEHRGWWQRTADDVSVCDLMREFAESDESDE